MEKIKACPYCGALADVVKSTRKNASEYYYVECVKCGARSGRVEVPQVRWLHDDDKPWNNEDFRTAVKQWNETRRANDA